MQNSEKENTSIQAQKKGVIQPPMTASPFEDFLSLSKNEALKGNFVSALKHCEAAFKLDPKNVNVYIQLSQLFEQTHAFDSAIKWLKKAAELKPKDISLLLKVGDLYQLLGDNEKALIYYQSVLNSHPNNSLAHVCLGIYYKGFGDKPAALAHFEAALKMDPESALALIEIALIKKPASNDVIFTSLLSLANSNKSSAYDKKNIAFALGQIYEKHKNYDSSFYWYSKGNQYRNEVSGKKFNLDEFKGTIHNLMELCTSEFFEKYKNLGSISDKPIFVLGMPRSGTTLTEQILSTHKDVYGAGELYWFHDRAKAISDIGINAINKELLQRQSEYYLKQITELSPGTAHVIDKMPHNFLRIWAIQLMFPKAYIIHCTRNPMDVCMSIYFHNFTSGHDYKNELNTLGQYYSAYLKLMDHWKKTLLMPILDVSYEGLINDPEAETRKLFAFCKLAWEPNCLEFYKSGQNVLTASKLQVKQPLYKSSIEKWRPYEKHLLPLLAELDH